MIDAIDTSGEGSVCPSCGELGSSQGVCAACIAPWVGSLIDRKLRLVRVVGQGGMGIVFEARHEVLDRRFAVKLLHARLARDVRALERFRREAKAAASLESQHIASIVDFGICDDGRTPFLVMEFLEGKDLATLLSRERIGARRAVELVLQAAKGLAGAHARAMVHRDLKPANLFVCKNEWGDDLVKVVDFGLAKLVTSSSSEAVTASGSVLGTPAYMAPEQARGERALDARADVFALGAILYECLSGHRPFGAESAHLALFKTMTGDVRPIRELCPGLPPALADFVMSCLALQRDRRPASADSFVAQLEPLLFQLPDEPLATGDRNLGEGVSRTAELSTGPVASAAPPRPRVRVVAIAAAGLIVVAAAAIGARSRSATSGSNPPAPAPSVVQVPRSNARSERSAVAPTAAPAPDAPIPTPSTTATPPRRASRRPSRVVPAVATRPQPEPPTPPAPPARANLAPLVDRDDPYAQTR